jgi:hypothetical protein
MASGAGLNRVGTLGGVPLLTVLPGASTPVAVTIGNYGTNSGMPVLPNTATVGTDSGVQMLSAAGFTKWTFCLIGPGVLAATTAAFTISLYGTIDPTLLTQAYQTGGNAIGVQGKDPSFTTSLTAIPASSWFLLPAPSEQAGTGSVTNPIVTSATGASILTVSAPLVAVRAVLTGTAPTTGTAGITVLGFAVP